MAEVEKIRCVIAINELSRKPFIKNLRVSQHVKNAEDTKDDVPATFNTWINYWETFAQENIPTICPLCGKAMTKEQVDGCHILIKSESFTSIDYYEDTLYIIPGHHDCNCKFGQEFCLKTDVTAIEAIKKQNRK